MAVVIPVRNGEATLGPLLRDLHGQSYPATRYEVIVVDDHSTDGTAAVVRNMQGNWPELRYEALTEAVGKKQAIQHGVHASRSEVVVTTDADARCGPGRLTAIAHYWMRVVPDMVLMPVHTLRVRGPLGCYQYHEQLALQAATAGSALSGHPVLANGANMAFSREVFMELGGYGPDRWASGDDLFLLKRMCDARRKVIYLLDADATVLVRPALGFSEFLSQRIRWAGKMRAIRQVPGTLAGVFVLLFPWLLLISSVHVWQDEEAIARNVAIGILFVAWFLWLLPILRLNRAMGRFFNNPVTDRTASGPTLRHAAEALLALLGFTLLAPIIAILSIFVRPMWKGRRI